jgi:hypothetical protein
VKIIKFMKPFTSVVKFLNSRSGVKGAGPGMGPFWSETVKVFIKTM